jgi:GH15 family glucan-1,4-alpha-glucosidase
MDLYTASTRLAQSFRIDGAPLELSQHGLVGDGFSCALVGVDGSVGWMCMPRFDSPSVFASILDPERGGHCRISPSSERFESLQAYDTATAVLQTLFRKPGEGAAVLTDFMPMTDDGHNSVHELHRLLEVREGSLDLEVVFDPRFDYARGETRIQITAEGAVAEGPNGERMTISLGRGLRFETRPQGGVVVRFTLSAGQRVWAILSWRAKRPEVVEAYRPFEHLRRTRRYWRDWTSRLRYDGPWRHDVLRSGLTLKLLQYAPTGAMVAAPTTSLPAWPGGDRNWDYRYSWIRDSAMAIRAMNLIGYTQEAHGFFEFVRDCVDRRGALDLMVTIDGQHVPDEEILSHLSGHGLGGPVRIGNAAADQLQHDIIGPLLDAAFVHEHSGGMSSLRLWREIRHLVDSAIDTIDKPDHGIWEPRSEPRHNVHSKLMTWVALDRGLRLAPLFGGDRQQKRWSRACDALREEILTRGYSKQSGTFTAAYGAEDMDATLLLLPNYGFLPPEDPRIGRTLDRVMRELGDGPFLRRYRADDGIDSDEGAFILCGFWLAEALALAGRLDEALEVHQSHASTANHLGLFAEEVDAATGAALGNFPQAFSHLGQIQSAARLDLALRLRDEGYERPPRHALELTSQIRG